MAKTDPPHLLSRRTLLLALPFGLAGCARGPDISFALPDFAIGDYGPGYDNGYPLAAVDPMRVNSTYRRQAVAYGGSQRPGTISAR